MDITINIGNNQYAEAVLYQGFLLVGDPCVSISILSKLGRVAIFLSLYEMESQDGLNFLSQSRIDLDILTRLTDNPIISYNPL